MEQNIFRKLRLEAGLSQGALAKKMGYTSPQFCSNWERSLSLPPAYSVKKLGKLLNCDDFESIYIEHAVNIYIADLKKKIRGT